MRASDDRIRRDVEVWRNATPEERLAELAVMCAMADYVLARLDADPFREVTREPLPGDAIAALKALRQLPR